MSARKLDPLKAKALQDKGLNIPQIAEKFNVNKSTVSRALKKLKVAVVARSAVDCAPVYISNLDAEIGRLYNLVDRVSSQLDWFKANSHKDDNGEHLKWVAEMRKLLTAISNTKYRAFKGIQVVELLKVIDEAISYEPVEIQERIGQRIKNRLGVTIPRKVD